MWKGGIARSHGDEMKTYKLNLPGTGRTTAVKSSAYEFLWKQLAGTTLAAKAELFWRKGFVPCPPRFH
jgi:hypothetical protein